jgi:hypothetical protein
MLVIGRRQFGTRPGAGAAERLGRQAFATLCAPRRQHPATARGGHARTKAVAALADELAGLVSALHGTGSKGNCLD